ATEAPDHIPFPQLAGEQPGNMAQRLVTAVMTEFVIERLESVQIGHGHADGTALPPTALALTAKQHLVLATVEQSGQRVGGGLALEFLLQQATALDLLLQLPVGPPRLAVHGELARSEERRGGTESRS